MFAEAEPVVAPEVYLDWLIVQHTCEWCGGDVDWIDPKDGAVGIKPAQWMCRTVKRSGYTSKHWRFWRICQQCQFEGSFEGFSKWIFPAIKNVPMIGESLAALMQVQPMSEPRGEIFYREIIERPLRGRRREGVMLDDAGLWLDEATQDRARMNRERTVRVNPQERTIQVQYKIRPLKALETIKLDFTITSDGTVVKA